MIIFAIKWLNEFPLEYYACMHVLSRMSLNLQTKLVTIIERHIFSVLKGHAFHHVFLVTAGGHIYSTHLQKSTRRSAWENTGWSLSLLYLRKYSWGTFLGTWKRRWLGRVSMHIPRLNHTLVILVISLLSMIKLLGLQTKKETHMSFTLTFFNTWKSLFTSGVPQKCILWLLLSL